MSRPTPAGCDASNSSALTLFDRKLGLECNQFNDVRTPPLSSKESAQVLSAVRIPINPTIIELLGALKTPGNGNKEASGRRKRRTRIVKAVMIVQRSQSLFLDPSIFLQQRVWHPKLLV